MSKVGLTVRWLVVPLSFIAFNTSMAADCGPGDHWVDGCASGTDKAPSTKGEFELHKGSCSGDLLGTLTFTGPTTIFRGDPQDALVGDPDVGNIGIFDSHLDVIKTELVSMKLQGSGFVVTAGDGVGDLLPTPPDDRLYSPGYIQEKSSDPARADSKFKIFFEIKNKKSGVVWHNNEPCEMTAEIDRVPPLVKKTDLTLNSYQCDNVNLFDENETQVGCLVHAKHELPVTFSQPLTARSRGNGISLSWTTGYEEKMAGFVTYRGELKDETGACTDNVNDYAAITMISWEDSQVGGSNSGASYSVIDSDGKSNSCYGLVAVGFDGTFEVQTTKVSE